MIQIVCLLFLLRITIIVECTTRISYIDSASYIPTNFSNVLSYNGTCSECICYAFFSNDHSTYEALNCYKNNNTCLLFPSFLSRSNIRINTNTEFVFLQQSSYTLASCIVEYGQCDGNSLTSTTNCCPGLPCIYKNVSYSQCLLTVDTSTAMTSIASLATVSYFNDSRQNATISTYWDCCKVSCGWPNKAAVTSPPETCTQDGVTAIDSNTQSVCDGGSSYMCTDQQPWNVSNSLSYGYAGASIIGEGEPDWCCSCYSLLFTSDPIIGKEMIVQVINTAYTSNNMFILQIPGGGWGGSTNGCLNQFNSSYSWGNQYGGISNRSACTNLPSVLQAGCYWRFDWFMNANSVSVRFKEVSCPTNLTAKTGCIRT